MSMPASRWAVAPMCRRFHPRDGHPLRLQCRVIARRVRPRLCQAGHHRGHVAPGRGQTWYEYRKIFINGQRIRVEPPSGANMPPRWPAPSRPMACPQKLWLPSSEWKPQYGGNMGNYRVLEALATLAFDYPRRGAYFRKEVENFLLLTRAEGVDPLTPRGSMPERWALASSCPAATAVTRWISTATGIAISGPISRCHRQCRPLFRRSRLAPRQEAICRGHGQWHGLCGTDQRQARSAHTQRCQPAGRRRAPAGRSEYCPAGAAAEIRRRQGPEYWLGFANFYAITRYNHSQLYAMAVYQHWPRISATAISGPSVAAPAPQARVD